MHKLKLRVLLNATSSDLVHGGDFSRPRGEALQQVASRREAPARNGNEVSPEGAGSGEAAAVVPERPCSETTGGSASNAEATVTLHTHIINKLEKLNLRMEKNGPRVTTSSGRKVRSGRCCQPIRRRGGSRAPGGRPRGHPTQALLG